MPYRHMEEWGPKLVWIEEKILDPTATPTP
jgi:hypothetical protein